MRFDDSLTTVLAADAGSPAGAAAAWRQLCDLVGRRRVANVDVAVARLRELRARVPAAVRAASGRALATVDAPAALVALFAEDDPPIAAPVLRTAALAASEWLALLPRLTPRTRSVLRHRRDLPATVVRGLDSFGATDFVLGDDRSAGDAPPAEATPAVALEESDDAEGAPRFEIADLVARLDAFQRERPVMAPAVAADPAPAVDRFDFSTDATGTIRWVEGVARAPLIGVSLGGEATQGLARLARPVRAHAPFRDVALDIDGDSSAAGAWRLTGAPRFDAGGGHFTGFAGIARRAPMTAAPAASASDSLRTLVHELRTPANAIAGFAELIGSELVGPVAPVYRDRAALIQHQAGGLTAAIDDLDTAARLDGDALERRPASVDVAALVKQASAALDPVARRRDVTVILDLPERAVAAGDDRHLCRLVDRLLAIAVAGAAPGGTVAVRLVAKTRSVRLHVSRPPALAVADEDEALLAIDPGEGGDDALPLGARFTLRVLRRLAAASAGSLTIDADRLTLRLPTPVAAGVEMATAP